MQYTIVCQWNGKTILNGKATAAMAWDISRGFLDENFAGREHRQRLDMHLSLHSVDTILTLKPRDNVQWEYRDETGFAHVWIARDE